GQQYGLLFVVKEGGGGDWGQVAWRREGDNTPAGSLQPLVSVVYWYGPGEGGGGGEGPKIESIELQGENIVITYSSGTLQSATSIEGPWETVPNAASPYNEPITGEHKFFRLV